MTLKIGLAALMLAAAVGSSPAGAANDAVPRDVPPGTKLVVADQNEALQTLMKASGEQDRFVADVTYANFLGGPAILEAFRAGALDLASVGNTPPIQAQAAGEAIPIVAAVTSAVVDYSLAVRPGLTVKTLEDLKGKRISYAEGTGRQPFVLHALKAAGLTRKDVVLVPLRVSDFPDAIRTGQVDVAVLNEPHFSRYLADTEGASALPDSEHDRLPRRLSYLYASTKALSEPGKAAAIRDFVTRWITAKRWAAANTDAWVKAYFVDRQRLSAADGRAIAVSEGEPTFPLLSELVPRQQELVDIIHEAGDLPERLDASRQFDLRFDAVIAAATRD
ncbi:sulfonate transport system substrate-binding protein [Chelatococcus caeni]|uniref:Sulfonate transport system substrate-binding protein n=1 Tax=Chelatococcus caeni TaxID=1348468 RepID=A0A840BQV1_9HYPH|nr:MULTISPECIES: ABC transporter substrate-binding protein [Chelatococcus]MBB4015735.1 sulfonate transport system substrate-binding protein [Chelatococcus caeni]